MKKIVGITFGRTTTTECQIHFNEMSDALLWDYVVVDNILCQIIKIERTEESTIATLKVIGTPNQKGLELPRMPIEIASNVYKAPRNYIKKAFGFRRNGVLLGNLHRYPDVKIYADYNDLVQRHLSVIGTTGSGKSSSVRCIIEDYISTGIPIVIVDISGEYTTLREANIDDFERLLDFDIRPEVISSKIEIYSPVKRNGCKLLKVSTTNLSIDEIAKLNSKYLSTFTPSQLNLLKGCIKKLQEKRNVMAEKGVEWDYEISDIKNLVQTEAKNTSTKASLSIILENIENMDIFSKTKDDDCIDINGMIKTKKCHVINLSYLEEQSEKEIIVSKILTDIYELKKNSMLRGKVKPVIVVLDEAQNWIPQSTTTYTSYIVKKMITEGRKMGIGMIIASVRPQSLSKDILSQTRSQIFFRITNDNDIDWIGKSFESVDKNLLSQLPQLKPGEGILAGVGRPIRIQFRPPKTRHGGKSVSFDGKNKLI